MTGRISNLELPVGDLLHEESRLAEYDIGATRAPGALPVGLPQSNFTSCLMLGANSRSSHSVILCDCKSKSRYE